MNTDGSLRFWPPRAQDYEKIYELHRSDPLVGRRFGHNLTSGEFRDVLSQQLLWHVVAGAPDFVGHGLVYAFDSHSRRARLAVDILPAERMKGYATQVAARVVSDIAERYPIRKIEFHLLSPGWVPRCTEAVVPWYEGSARGPQFLVHGGLLLEDPPQA